MHPCVLCWRLFNQTRARAGNGRPTRHDRLFSVRASRNSISNEPVASPFVELKNLPPAPRKEDEAWSEWIFATERADLTPIPDSERFAIRYRVHPIER